MKKSKNNNTHMKRRYSGQYYGKPVQYKKRRTQGQYTGTRKSAYSGSLASKAEKKVADINTATYQVNTTGSFTLLACPQVGADFNARVGRKVLLKSLYIRGFVAQEAALGGLAQGTYPEQYRMIVFVDLQPNGAAPAVTDLLVEAKSQSQLNLNNRDRFKVIADKMFICDPYFVSTTAGSTYASAPNQMKNIKCYKKLNVETIFNATNAGNIGDITSGALYMFWIGSQAAGSVDGNAIVSTRVRYTDI